VDVTGSRRKGCSDLALGIALVARF